MEDACIKVFVTVGSRNYPFNRLFVKLDELVETGLIRANIFAQIGTTTYQPKYYRYIDFVSPEEFEQHINNADLVISHGASGSIMKALNSGKKVLAVTRLSKYGEHIDDHQIQNNQAFESNKYVVAAYEMDELYEAYKSITEGTADIRPFVNNDNQAILRMVDQFIQRTWNEK